MKLTDFPRHFSIETYDESIRRMVERLNTMGSVQSVYQIGGVSTPGISDIDLLVIFNDGSRCDINPLSNLTTDDSYLYIHNLYGMSESYFSRSLHLPFFHGYNLLWGHDHRPVMFDKMSAIMKAQIALEYLVKMFVNMTVEKTYGIMKVRGLLLHTKALLIDAEYIGITSGRFLELLEDILEWRMYWFKRKPSNAILRKWHSEFYVELENVLESFLKTNPLHIPEWADLRIGRNLMITPSSEFNYHHSGITLPSLFGGLGKKYFNIQNRMNDFEFMIPVRQSEISCDLLERHEFVTQVSEFNAEKYPYFIPVVYGLSVYKKKDSG